MENNKVYVLREEYYFEGDVESNCTIFDTFEKAKVAFEERAKIEKEQSWINQLDDEDLETMKSDESDTYLHAYDSSNYYSTTVWVEEKEIL